MLRNRKQGYPKRYVDALLGNKDEGVVFKCVAAVDKSMRFGNQSSFAQRGRGRGSNRAFVQCFLCGQCGLYQRFRPTNQRVSAPPPHKRGRFSGAEGAFPVCLYSLVSHRLFGFNIGCFKKKQKQKKN